MLVSLTLFVWLFQNVSLEDLLVVGRSGRAGTAVLVILLQIGISTSLAGLGLSFILGPPRALRALIVASFKLESLSLLVPGRLGDLALATLLDHTYPRTRLLAAVVVDKAVSLLVTCVIAGVGLRVLFDSARGAALLGGVAVASGLGLLLSSSSRFDPAPFVSRFLPARLARPAGDLLAHVRSMGSPGILLLNVVTTVLRGMSGAVALVLALECFGGKVDIPTVFLVQGLVQLSSLLPIAYRGMGFVEALTVPLLARYGIPPEVSLATLLLGRLVHALAMGIVVLAWVLAGDWDGKRPESPEPSGEKAASPD